MGPYPTGSNRSTPWVTQNANSEFLHLLLEDQIITCFFVKFLGTMIESDDCTIIESNNMKHFKIASKWEKSTIFLPEPSVHETLVGPCSSYFSGTIPQSRIYSLLPPHQPRVETRKAATKLLLQFSTTIERLGKNGWSFEDRQYHSTWFEEPSYWLLYTHIPFICMIGWFSWYSLFIPSLLWMMAFYQLQNIRRVKKFNKFNVPLATASPCPIIAQNNRHITVFSSGLPGVLKTILHHCPFLLLLSILFNFGIW